MAGYSAWIGRERRSTALIEASAALRLAATLDRDDPPPRPGDSLPHAWHWISFHEADRQSALSADGRGARGGLLPELDGLSRMWAGGAFRFTRPLRIGERAERRSRVLSITPKQGRSGRLVLATIEHLLSGEDGSEAFAEEHHLVFRERRPLTGEAPGETAAEMPVWRRAWTPDAVMLFRFSALTFNGHRIHYDHRYTSEVEGYPDLLVHGPLTAVLLLDLLRREAGGRRLSSFSYRATRPLFVDRELAVCGVPSADGRTASLWAGDDRGFVAMRAEAEFA